MAKKNEIAEKFPPVVEHIAQIIEKGLVRFSPEERGARLDKIHLILAGRAKTRRKRQSPAKKTRA